MTTVQEFFDDKVRLPSPPAIALKILEAVRQEENLLMILPGLFGLILPLVYVF